MKKESNLSIGVYLFVSHYLLVFLLSGLISFFGCFSTMASGMGTNNCLSYSSKAGYFSLSHNGKATPVYVDTTDFAGVKRTVNDFCSDIGRVTGATPKRIKNNPAIPAYVVLVGTIGKSRMIDLLIRNGKIDVSTISGKWESYIIQTIKNPFGKTGSALIIAGSDKRGTIYGMYDLSAQMGVSPWHWWADVPPRKHASLFVKPGKFIQGPPSVKYRGIFINDEWPTLSGWVTEKYGTTKLSLNPPVPKGYANYNSLFYSRVFELLLRLRANYLWPAMWGNAFNEDDPENPRLADEYGIVMGTSHQEPMMRAQKEWDRRYSAKLGSWNYAKDPDTLVNFWRSGIRRNKNYENIVTLGLRGADDTEMAPGGPEANRAMLEQIVERQRTILKEEVNPNLNQIPQLWCLYKEVLDYYDAGMRVPDDVTLLWAEDNWGNVRRLPTADERRRSGGSGVYYHFDYHGSPRSYEWINSTQLSKVWDQMTLSKQYGADRIWIVNVGHLRGYELPMEYFMDLAYNTNQSNLSNTREYTRLWAQKTFGPQYATDIAAILAGYTRINSRRKPESIEVSTYSLVNYHEAESVVAEYKHLHAKSEAIYARLSPSMRDAFYHIVLFPVRACAQVNELYLAAAKNKLYASQGRASANDYATETRRLFAADSLLMHHYNHIYANGRWNHFMDQVHIGYTSWNPPRVNSLNALTLTENRVPAVASMGVAIEGSEEVWPSAGSDAVLPDIDAFNRQTRYLDIFNKGSVPFEYRIETDQPWIVVSAPRGKIEKEARIGISVNWHLAPKGKSENRITVHGPDGRVSVKVRLHNPTEVTRNNLRGFVESNGYVSIEAEHFTSQSNYADSKWTKIVDYGHTLSGMRATAPAHAQKNIAAKDAPCLRYRIYLFGTGRITVQARFGAIMNFMPHRAISYAVSVDDEVPQKITLVPEGYKVYNENPDWAKVVTDNARTGTSTHTILRPRYHTLTLRMIDPGPVLQKILVSFQDPGYSYLWPPESFWR